jgi:predicted GNAT family N-acyltransferase
MGTPAITLTHLVPSDLTAYQAKRLPAEQPDSVPAVFRDAMIVRVAVFVEEQGVPLDGEFDADDPRSAHWVAYAAGSPPVPVGTLRLVPFPHAPHPRPGGVYVAVDGDLVLAGTSDGDSGELLKGADGSVVAPPPGDGDGVDKATTLHDGVEPYVKLGRLAVLKDYRGHKVGRLLVGGALEWMRENLTFFDGDGDGGHFQGLVCAHAQEAVAGAWGRMGFEVDNGMGKWWEEGIPHVGMFQRLDVDVKQLGVDTEELDVEVEKLDMKAGQLDVQMEQL